MTIRYLTIEQILALHDIGIQELGGTFGIRDRHLLESAAHQPQQAFGGQEIYPTVFDKAAAYAYFISENQPFLDGNKRTAISVAVVFLDLNGYEIVVPEGAIYDVTMRVGNKQLNREGLAEWFRKNSRRRRKR